MKCNKKIYFLLVLVLMFVLVPFNVLAVEDTTTQTPEGTENTETENPIVPGNPTEGETPDSGTEEETKPVEPENNTPSVEQPEKEEAKPENNTEIKEESNKEETKKEETKKEETKKEETTTKKPTVIRPTTIVDNATRRVEISILGKDNKLLSGVKFQIQDKKGNIFYEEETTDQVYVFEEMELGTYYLVQVSTIDGYAENTERIEFEVSEESEIVKVELKNKLKSEEKQKKEKDAFALELPLLCSVAMFDIALCIGVIVYVKKRKQKHKK